SYGDWSSDVCSSDLCFNVKVVVVSIALTHNELFCISLADPNRLLAIMPLAFLPKTICGEPLLKSQSEAMYVPPPIFTLPLVMVRSEERRVGKACRCW